jgi:hypothetical protein
MSPAAQRVLAATLLFAVTSHAGTTLAQTTLSATREQSPSAYRSSGNQTPSFFPLAPEFLPPQPLFDFKDSSIKFKLETLMNILRDSKHESWVLAAYPDPKTGRPLIGAGFNLDVSATQHIQTNPLNPHLFIEPSTAELWQDAGLDLGRLQSLLDQFDHDMKTWQKKKFRRKIRTHQLTPEISEQEATNLLRISTLEAIHNARAYCDDFDYLTASQQMALSQLVYQMGVNLEEFVDFLSAINDQSSYRDLAQAQGSIQEGEHWKTVQRTLIESDWARRYTSRAVTVIAMFNPDYNNEPKEAEREVRTQIYPLVAHHRKKPHAEAVRANNSSHANQSQKLNECQVRVESDQQPRPSR